MTGNRPTVPRSSKSHTREGRLHHVRLLEAAANVPHGVPWHDQPGSLPRFVNDDSVCFFKDRRHSDFCINHLHFHKLQMRLAALSLRCARKCVGPRWDAPTLLIPNWWCPSCQMVNKDKCLQSSDEVSLS